MPRLKTAGLFFLFVANPVTGVAPTDTVGLACTEIVRQAGMVNIRL